MPVLDFRSDSVTRPGAEMCRAMAAAPLGDDVFGDDPSVNALQEKLAALLGFEAALFVPSGTQANLCAILAQCQRGDEYLVAQHAHCYGWEAGGIAVLGSVQPQPLAQQADGCMALDDIAAAIRPDDEHFPRTRLLALENTWAGQVLSLDYVHAACALAHAQGLSCHLDGARLFNAAVGQAAVLGGDAYAHARAIAACFDSVSVCFSKGLGAPVGSALCGSRALIARARRLRKMAGGGMHQVGALAAAAAYALDHNVYRLAEDHALAARLGAGLQDIAQLQVQTPQTNMVWLDVRASDAREARQQVQALVDYLAQHGILATGQQRVRLVTHLDLVPAALDRVFETVQRFFRR